MKNTAMSLVPRSGFVPLPTPGSETFVSTRWVSVLTFTLTLLITTGGVGTAESSTPVVGKIATIDRAKKTLGIASAGVAGNPVTVVLTVTDGTAFTVGGVIRRDLNYLRPGQDVEAIESNGVATAVMVSTVKLVGKITSIDVGKKTVGIVPSEASFGQDAVTIAVAADTAIVEEDDKRSISDLRVGEHVQATVTKGTATGIARLVVLRNPAVLDILGPFLWTRTCDVGEKVEFRDAQGNPSPDGDFLFCHAITRLEPNLPYRHKHAENNLVCRSPDLAFELQFHRFDIRTPQQHAAENYFGYVAKDRRFQHGDHRDLGHWADADRVVVCLPVYHEGASGADQRSYRIRSAPGTVSACVMQFAKGENIKHDWFGRDRKSNILFDLAPHLGGTNDLLRSPGKLAFRFDVRAGGGWLLRIRQDDDSAEPAKRHRELAFTHESPNAKPYSVAVEATSSFWAVSVGTPGGGPADICDMTLRLRPYDRSNGQDTDWPDRKTVVRNVSHHKLDIER